MIESIILDYLTSSLDVPVYMEKPSDEHPASYVVIEKTSGSITNFIGSAMIAVQSYAESLYAAAQLNTEVIEAMVDIASGVEGVSHSNLNSDYNFTNTQTKEYRYQAVFDVSYYIWQRR